MNAFLRRCLLLPLLTVLAAWPAPAETPTSTAVARVFAGEAVVRGDDENELRRPVAVAAFIVK